MMIDLVKAGDNPDQRPTQQIVGPSNPDVEIIKVGDVIHIGRQPEDVKWRVVGIGRTVTAFRR
jgi:hypothetical protein